MHQYTYYSHTHTFGWYLLCKQSVCPHVSVGVSVADLRKRCCWLSRPAACCFSDEETAECSTYNITQRHTPTQVLKGTVVKSETPLFKSFLKKRSVVISRIWRLGLFLYCPPSLSAAVEVLGKRVFWPRIRKFVKKCHVCSFWMYKTWRLSSRSLFSSGVKTPRVSWTVMKQAWLQKQLSGRIFISELTVKAPPPRYLIAQQWPPSSRPLRKRPELHHLILLLLVDHRYGMNHNTIVFPSFDRRGIITRPFPNGRPGQVQQNTQNPDSGDRGRAMETETSPHRRRGVACWQWKLRRVGGVRLGSAGRPTGSGGQTQWNGDL